MVSVRGIYYDLNESIYTFKYDNLMFYFSSRFYLDKFRDQYSKYIKEESSKLRSKYKCKLYCDDMLLLCLYKKIEKRGFKVLYNNKEVDEDYFIDALIDENCSIVGD